MDNKKATQVLFKLRAILDKTDIYVASVQLGGSELYLAFQSEDNEGRETVSPKRCHQVKGTVGSCTIIHLWDDWIVSIKKVVGRKSVGSCDLVDHACQS